MNDDKPYTLEDFDTGPFGVFFTKEVHNHQRIYATAKALSALVKVIKEHRSQKCDDRCVEDDDRLYEALGDGIKCDRRVGSKEDMLRNCARFINRRCEGGGWPTYAQLEEQIHQLKFDLNEAQVNYRIAKGQRDGMKETEAELLVTVSDQANTISMLELTVKTLQQTPEREEQRRALKHVEDRYAKELDALTAETTRLNETLVAERLNADNMAMALEAYETALDAHGAGSGRVIEAIQQELERTFDYLRTMSLMNHKALRKE